MLLLVGMQSAAFLQEIEFERDIQSLFRKHCYDCHSQENQESGLRLDIRSAAFRGGDRQGPDIVPHDPDRSPLIQRIRESDPEKRMPPGASLSSNEIDRLTRWIEQGAKWPAGMDDGREVNRLEHWSFQPMQSSRHASIDAFIDARLASHGLQRSPRAQPIEWLRRVSYDLTGLTPTWEDAASFTNRLQESSNHEEAYREVVDRLLASPRHGERWAQHWLDVVRYADTHGFEVNTERPHAWPYRDYVIRAFNADIPFDQFVKEQIAGDQLGQDAATGFLVTASVLLPGQIGKDDASIRLARQDALDEIVNNISQTFLALSVGCARCHDHKFDPTTSVDYYAMQALVAGVEYEDREWKSSHKEPPTRTPDSSVSNLAPKDPVRDGVSASANDSVATKAPRPEAPKVFAGRFRDPDVIRWLTRGDPEQPQQVVAPGVPGFLGNLKLSESDSESHRRQSLSEWLVAPTHVLTARVIVNRVWQGHFGVGLVDTPSDFGRSGSPPSHPELLDWLALGLIEDGWSLKGLHRRIVLSETYRQSSYAESNDKALRLDGESRWLWRYPIRRLDAEEIRDSLLMMSGELMSEMYGRGFDLFDKRGGLSGFRPVESFSARGFKRAIYAHRVRRERDAVFGVFDCPDAGQSTAKRRESTTPIQALNLFNSVFTVERCSVLAKRILQEEPTELQAQVRSAYHLILLRDPNSEEMSIAIPLVQEHGLESLCRALLNTNEFIYIP
jgi:hypothetical protein